MNSTTHLAYPTIPLTDSELPTQIKKDCGTVLVTGASGYVGGRLIPVLLIRGYKVRILVRKYIPEYEHIWPNVEVVVGSTFNLESLQKALSGIDVAYYLIHSLLTKPKDFIDKEIESAHNFRVTAEQQKVNRIIYLGGLGKVEESLSKHLYSRLMVNEELRKGKVPVTTLRAATIIGSGSASYELMQNVTEFFPVIPSTSYTSTKCQPISIRDVRKYLVGVLEEIDTKGKQFDIGGPEVLTYHQMLEIFAKVLQKKKKRFFIPLRSTSIASYFLSFISTVPATLIKNLMEGLKNDVICSENSIEKYLPINKLNFREALERAVLIEKKKEVTTRWSDTYHPLKTRHIKLDELPEPPNFVVSYSIKSSKKARALFQSICQVGGKKGWFHNNWMWRLRGLVDRIFLGVGTARGRRSDQKLKTNDVLDFWRVEKIVQNRELLLFAEMKLPGLAWLKFEVIDIDNEGVEKKDYRDLRVTAYFATSSLAGSTYWYFFLPFHHFIFEGLLKQLEARSDSSDCPSN